MVSKELLNELFEYKNGALYWKQNRAKNKIKSGDLAGYIDSKGYSQIVINRKKYGTHRLIFMMFNGYTPTEIDHIDRNPLNNKIENLRAATRQENQYNHKINKRNTSGIKGVSWSKNHKKWIVRFNIDGKPKYFGHYFDINIAKFVAEAMRYKYHGNFANNG